jgi:hypothetical protein
MRTTRLSDWKKILRKWEEQSWKRQKWILNFIKGGEKI